MKEDNRFRYSNFDEVFGALEKVHRTRRGLAENFLSPAVLFFLVSFGVITYVASRDAWTIPCCIVVPVILFALTVWHLFTTRRDELRIYEHGFTYRAAGALHACRWTDIAICHRREANDRELKELPAGAFPLGAVEKKNGERIVFDQDVPGTPQIAARFENPGSKPK